VGHALAAPLDTAGAAGPTDRDPDRAACRGTKPGLDDGLQGLAGGEGDRGCSAVTIQQACEAKIPVIVLDRTVHTDCYTSFIGGNNVEIGRRTGRRRSTRCRTAATWRSWKPARDDVYAPGYEVYVSKQAGFEPRSSNRVGTTALPSFAHTGLGIRETWHYRVRAVDAAGHAGPYSAEVSATTGDAFRIEAEGLLRRGPVRPRAAVVPGHQGRGRGDGRVRPAEGGDVRRNVRDDQGRRLRHRHAGAGRTRIGAPLDAYHNGVTVTLPIDAGAHRLAAGRHTLTLTVIGKNAASTGFSAGLDYVAFQLTT
jgi:hypothetical protein